MYAQRRRDAHLLGDEARAVTKRKARRGASRVTEHTFSRASSETVRSRENNNCAGVASLLLVAVVVALSWVPRPPGKRANARPRPCARRRVFFCAGRVTRPAERCRLTRRESLLSRAHARIRDNGCFVYFPAFARMPFFHRSGRRAALHLFFAVGGSWCLVWLGRFSFVWRFCLVSWSEAGMRMRSLIC